MAKRLYELTPVGVGGAFSSLRYNSWYMVMGDHLYLFDCPHTNLQFFTSKEGMKVLENINRVVVFITHTHEDHVGGLSNFGMFLEYVLNIPMMVFFHKDLIMQMMNYIAITGYTPNQASLSRGDYYQDDNIQVVPLEVSHVPNLKCYSFAVYIDDFLQNNPDGNCWQIYYSGDNRNFASEEIVDSFLADPTYKMMYHEVTYNASSEVHCYKDKITTIIPKPLRNHIVPMHLDRIGDYKKLLRLGFHPYPDKYKII